MSDDFRMDAASARRWARWAGVLLLVSIVGGIFGEMVVPGRIVVPGDAAATARKLQASGQLFRLGFAGYLCEALCDVTLSLAFYVLLRPASRPLALLAAFFGLVSTALFGVGELFFFAASLFVGDRNPLKALPPGQSEAAVLLCIRMYELAGGVFMAFYGVASALRGWVMLRSGYLPKALGALLMLAGLSFVVRNFLLVLAPAYASDALLAPMGLAGLSMAAWFLARGVDAAGWDAASRPRA